MSTFTIIADMEGKVQHCLFDDSRLQFATHVGDIFAEILKTSVPADLQDFLTGAPAVGNPTHMEIHVSGDAPETMLLSRLDCEIGMILAGTTVSTDADQAEVNAVKQKDRQLLAVIHNLLSQGNTLDDVSGEDTKEESTSREVRRAAQRKVYQFQKELARHQKQMTMFNRMDSALQMCNTLEELYKVIGIFTEKLFDSNGGNLYIYRPEVNHFEACAHWGDIEDSAIQDLDEEKFVELLNQQSSEQKIAEFLYERGRSDCLLLRIPADGSMIGVLHVCLRKEISISNPFFDHYQQAFLRMIGLSIANMRYRLWLDQDAMQDHLTNLYNRRFLTLQLEREYSRALRQGSFFSVVMLDLDDFTGLNVTYGPLTGDQYLIEFGKLLTRCVRKEDYVCRYGKDEFALVLVDSAQEDALMILDRVKAECKAVRVSGLTVPMPFSSGVATFPTDARTPEALLKRAEEVLYLMKRRKRQRK